VSEVRRTAFEFEPRPGEVLRGDLWTPSSLDATDADRAVVVCHGFKGFKDWGFFPHAARHMAGRLDCRVVTFNFTGSGVGADFETFTEREAFARNTFSKELGDLTSVLDGLWRGELGDLAFEPVGRLGVLGHSRGGVAAILTGELPPVRAVVTWAAIASVERYAAMFVGLDEDEPALVRNARTGDVLPLYRDVVEDMREHPDRFDLAASLGRSEVPLLVVHGTKDTSVPPDDGRHLAAASHQARLALVEGAGHTFETGHPFGGPSPELERALALTTRHFDLHV